MCRFVWLIILVGVFLFQNASHGAAQSIAVPRPELPYFDWNACPFEACAYGKWTAREVVPLYDTWKKRRLEIARLAAGDTVVAVTGVVITFKPGLIRMDRDLPADDLKAGDTILTYAYRGEGFSAVWFKGNYYSDFDITFTKWPNGRGGCGGAHCAATYVDLGKRACWAKVKLKSGRTGWVDMHQARFDGVNLLANR